MTDAIKIGKYIYYTLTENSTVSEYVGLNVYPVIAEESTSFPFIIYRRSSISVTDYSKDGYSEDMVDFSVMVASQNYEESCEIANEIRKLLEKKFKVFDNMEINDCRMVGISESYTDNAYVQSLDFQCTINKHN